MKPGIYTFQEALDLAGVDTNSITDFRTINVGGLTCDFLDETFRVPDTTDKLEVRIDNKLIQAIEIE